MYRCLTGKPSSTQPSPTLQISPTRTSTRRKQRGMPTTTGSCRTGSSPTITRAPLLATKYPRLMPSPRHSRVSTTHYTTLHMFSMTQKRYLPGDTRQGRVERAGEAADLAGAVRGLQPSPPPRHRHRPPSLRCHQIPPAPPPGTPL